MSSSVVFLAVLGLQMPACQAIQPLDWQPDFVAESKVELCSETVGFFTHCSNVFDPLGSTELGVNRSVRKLKLAGCPIVYFHDRYNPNNPPWNYLYDDWAPTYYVSSDIGHFQIDLDGVRHVVCHGGFFGQCERSTVCDVIRNWCRLQRRDDLRISQVVDATFTVGQFLPEDQAVTTSIRAALTERHKVHPKAVMTVEEVMTAIADPQLQVAYVRRQLPALPQNVNVVIDLLGERTTICRCSADVPTLTLAYVRSDQVLNFEPVILPWPQDSSTELSIPIASGQE